MFKNYFKVALRNVIRHKAFSFINIIGLTVGLVCTILILLWVQNETSYDRFHTNADQIYRVMSYGTKYFKEGIDGTPLPLAPAVKEEIPGISGYTRFADIPKMVFRYGEKSFYEDKGLAADPYIFEIFTFPFVKGDPKTSFTQPLDMVVTEKMAEKYFGKGEPMGKTLQVEDKLARVTGVIKNIPPNSHIKFDYLISYKALQEVAGWGQHWGAFNFVTYLQLEKGSDIKEIAGKMTEIAAKNNCPQVMDGVEFRLQPLLTIHLDPRGSYRNYIDVIDGKYVYIFSIIAIFILLIACVNFMNLSTARSAFRAREVGVRKTVGASRKKLVVQFFSESLLLTIIALFIGIIIMEMFLPVFNQLAGKQLSVEYLNFKHIAGFVGVVFLTGLIAGSYPALYLSAFKPVEFLKGVLKSDSKSPTFRKILVIIQFTIAIVLIVGLVVISKQLHYIKNKDLGFNKENIVYIPIKENIGKRYPYIKQNLLKDTNILSITALHYMFTDINPRNTAYGWEGKEPGQQVDMLLNLVDYDFFKTLNLEVVEGRSFSKEYATDAKEAYILNEEAVKEMGIESPVGKGFTYYKRKGTIIGVVKNAYFKSLHNRIEPHVFFMAEDFSKATEYGAIMIKINGDKVEEALTAIRRTWERINPISPFEFHFLDQTYENLYRNEKQIREILNYFTILAIFVSCLGLFGLASFMSEQRTKEIGIRKVLGASITEIILLLSKEFSRWVLIANVIGFPIAYYVMSKLLEIYPYRVKIGLFPLLISVTFTLIVALLTVSYQVIKVALANPVEALRYE